MRTFPEVEIKSTVGFNKKAYEGKSKAEFIEAEKHHAGTVDLSSEYDKLFPHKEEPSKPKAKAEENK